MERKKCRCECLKIKKCKIEYSWNVNNCRCEIKKLARLTQTEGCDIETDEIECKTSPKSIFKNKTITLIKKVENCKPSIGVSILFLCVSLVFGGIIIHLYFKSRNNSILPY